MKKLLIPFFLLGLLLNACKKDDTAALKPSENPMAKILEDKTWTQTQSPSAIAWELGFIFSVSSKGKITQLGCRLPEPGVYTVSLWEQSTKKLLRQKAVEQTSPDKFTLANVDELVIDKDVKYIVSVSSVVGGKAKFYYRIANSNTNIFPIVRGSILIQSSTYRSVATPTFPDEAIETGRMFGYADFTYIPD